MSFPRVHKFGGGSTITPEDYPLLAVAQHHQLPTRLLDWTDNPFVAAYFAASNAAFSENMDVWVESKNIKSASENTSNQRSIVVWALDTVIAEQSKTVAIIRVPYGGNVNLAAQHGLFTLTFPQEQKFHLPLEQILPSVNPSSSQVAMGVTFGKFSLPYSEVPLLLRYLSRLGYSASTLYPGFGGIVKDIIEERFRQPL